jgi:hypothetical protein
MPTLPPRQQHRPASIDVATDPVLARLDTLIEIADRSRYHLSQLQILARLAAIVAAGWFVLSMLAGR